MATLLIKNIPEKLRHRLQKTAKEHQRSMNQQAILSLADALDAMEALPKPMKIREPFDNSFINRAKRTGRP
jgi:plasmid stability protein